jgi:hypothetical protein
MAGKTHFGQTSKSNPSQPSQTKPSHPRQAVASPNPRQSAVGNRRARAAELAGPDLGDGHDPSDEAKGRPTPNWKLGFPKLSRGMPIIGMPIIGMPTKMIEGYWHKTLTEFYFRPDPRSQPKGLLVQALY